MNSTGRGLVIKAGTMQFRINFSTEDSDVLANYKSPFAAGLLMVAQRSHLLSSGNPPLPSDRAAAPAALDVHVASIENYRLRPLW